MTMASQEGKVQKTRTKRARVNFTINQLEAFEAVFQQTQYPDVTVLETLAERVELPVEKLCTWFQNRRSKFRKESKKGHITWMRQQMFSEVANDAKTPKSAGSSVLASSTTMSGFTVQDTSACHTAFHPSMSYKTQSQPVTYPISGKLPERYVQSAPPSELDFTFDYLNIPPITSSYLEELQNEDIQFDQSASSVCFPSYNTYPYSAWSGESSCNETRSACAYGRTNFSEFPSLPASGYSASETSAINTRYYQTDPSLSVDSPHCSTSASSNSSPDQASSFTRHTPSDVTKSSKSESSTPDTECYTPETSPADSIKETKDSTREANYTSGYASSNMNYVAAPSCTDTSPPLKPYTSYTVNTEANNNIVNYSHLPAPMYTTPYFNNSTSGNLSKNYYDSLYYTYPAAPVGYKSYQ